MDCYDSQHVVCVARTGPLACCIPGIRLRGNGKSCSVMKSQPLTAPGKEPTTLFFGSISSAGQHATASEYSVCSYHWCSLHGSPARVSEAIARLSDSAKQTDMDRTGGAAPRDESPTTTFMLSVRLADDWQCRSIPGAASASTAHVRAGSLPCPTELTPLPQPRCRSCR